MTGTIEQVFSSQKVAATYRYFQKGALSDHHRPISNVCEFDVAVLSKMASFSFGYNNIYYQGDYFPAKTADVM